MEKEDWVNTLLAYLTRWLSFSEGVAFTADYFAAEALLNGYPEPADKRYWGAVFQRAVRGKLIKQLVVGGVRVTATNAKGHRRSPMWVRA